MARDNRRNRPSYYAPPSRGNSSHHSVLGYWVPLVVTGTIAIGGLAAWIWSERTENDEDDYPGPKPQRPPTGEGKPYPTQGSQPYPGPPPPQQVPSGAGSGPPAYPGGPTPGPAGGEAASYYAQDSQSRDVYGAAQQHDDGSWYGRMQGVMRRTPSPQQFFDSASKQVSAGWAAAGAALGSIVEEEKDDDYEDSRRAIRSEERRSERRTAGKEEREKEGFSDHERWSEEADEKQRVSNVEADSSRRVGAAREEGKGKSRAKRAVAVVVSADTDVDIQADEAAGYRTEHASILSHLPSTHTSSTETTDLFVLIYAPTLKSLPPLDYQPQGHGIPSTVGSTYSAISTPAATPGSELQSISPRIDAADAPSKTFDLLYQQALALVPGARNILPFTTPAGFVSILRNLAPNLVYISDTLAGDEGANLKQLHGWVGNTVLVAGDQGTGGLADTETETEDERNEGGREKRKEAKWYEHSDLVGLGKGVEVVDAARVGEDWARRVGGRD